MKLHNSLSLAMMAVLMTACVSVSPVPMQTTVHVTDDAKNTLQQATKSQLRSTFGYRTDVYVTKLWQNLPMSLVKSKTEEEENLCQKTHDEAYIALLRTIKQEKASLEDELYQSQRQSIKEQFLACQKEQATYERFDFADFYKQVADEQEWQRIFEQATQSFQTHITSQQVVLPEVADIATEDTKKTQLIQEYLLKPTQISVIGRYEPLQQKITALPMVQYTAKNLLLSVNQPVYVDLSSGGVYLWADNLALANSQTLDKKLGDQWRNKWLFIPLNDGSLPKGFAKDFLQAYLLAKKESFMALPKNAFEFVDSQSLTTSSLAGTLPNHHLQTISKTPYIIKKQPTAKDVAYSNYVFMDTFYRSVMDKYADVFDEQLVNFDEHWIIEGESVIEILNRHNDKDVSRSSEQKAPIVLNSKLLMSLFLHRLDGKIGGYYEMLATQDDKKVIPTTHYGIEHGKIVWIHHQHSIGDGVDRTHIKEPVLVEVFTQILPKQMGEFDRLPVAMQTPTAQNTVNMFEYGHTLLEQLKNGDDGYLKMMTTLLFGESEEDIVEVLPNDEIAPQERESSDDQHNNSDDD